MITNAEKSVKFNYIRTFVLMPHDDVPPHVSMIVVDVLVGVAHDAVHVPDHLGLDVLPV